MNICNLFILYNIEIKKLIKTTFKQCYNEDIEMIYTNGPKHCYYLILVGIIVDYEEQVFTTKININIQYSIYHIFLQK